jgi:CDP-diacylglycerol--glycerol-3-phosphate 3-phosphatidyltransferase
VGTLGAADVRPLRRKRTRVARRRSNLRRELWNLPNLLTLARIAVIPPFAVFLGFGNPVSSFIAALIFACAALTDILDGVLARRLKLETVLGKFMDPLADKLIVMAALVMLTRMGWVEAAVVILLLGREFIISGLRTIAIGEGVVIPASQGGKWKTALQVAGIEGMLIHYPYEVDFLFGRYSIDFGAVGIWLLYISLVASLWSAVGYFRAFWSALPSPPTPPSPA